ncbi:MMPL family transporter [Kineococcus radiotolerans]|uniref:MMPL domain protein n=1 Tax=Kineococcus radiotolerans (strain ATCC BAA-149 / DSM 14245 / SRS30216) TaxID=266940 RepID=A6WBE5_KINRD|nr:MMPL family transporter [Kineococcus radiotolerans]ABS04134.1 MMPL domain protein [Kineococcus radiotolerans SRS30216 = ATCC BAA-149]
MSALARWCARRRWTVVAGWLLALVALATAALGVGTSFSDETNVPDSDSVRASALMAEAGLYSAGTAGTIVWHTDGVGVDDPSVVSDVTAALDQIAALPGVEAVVVPYTEAGAAQLNTAADTAYATVTLSSEDSVAQIEEIASGLDSSSLDVAVGGDAFAGEVGASGGTEGAGIFAALIVLLIVFRSLWGGLLPIITGVMGVGTSLLSILLLSNVMTLSANVITMGSLVGLGVGIDYALFIVNRYRNALMAGKSVQDAIAEAVNTSGRAVVFAGATVVIALLGVFIVQIDLLTAMARGAAVAVVMSVLAAITFLPGMLSLLGLRVLSKRQRRQLATTGPTTPDTTERGAARRWAGLVQRNPIRLAVLGLLVMVALAAPAVSLRLGANDASSDPTDSATYQYHAMMSEGFGDGFDASLVVVGRTPDASTQQAFDDLVTRIGTLDGVASVGAAPATGQAISAATVYPSTTAQAAETADLLDTLRDDVIPAAESGTGLEVYVGGSTASGLDFAEGTLSKIPVFLALIAVLGFLLLVIAFRSILIPLIGALGNLVTLAVSLGVLVLGFQQGYITEVLQLGTGAPIEAFVAVLGIGILFGLAMDYQVFLVSRMKEEWEHAHDNARAVRVGMAETTKVIATAAVIMFCVFIAFGFAGQRVVAEIGVGLAVAVLVDAFILRLTVIPALMHLIGDRNWSYPRWADRITPRVSIEGETTPAPAPVAATATAAGPAIPASAASRDGVIEMAPTTRGRQND